MFWNEQAVESKQALEALFQTVAQKADQDQIKLKADRAAGDINTLRWSWPQRNALM